MKKQRFTIVIETSDYRIVRSAEARDFDAFVSGAGYIGTRATQSEAQRLIDQYRYDTMTHAPMTDEAFITQQAQAAHLANVTGKSAYVIAQPDGYHLAAAEDIGLFWEADQIVYTAEPMRRAA